MAWRKRGVATAWGVAAGEGHVEVAEFLIDRRAEVEPRDEDEATPLQIAAGYSRTSVVRLLLEAGADCEAIEKAGWSPLGRALWPEHREIADLLLREGAEPTLLDLAMAGHCASMRAMIQAGAVVGEQA